MRVIAIYLGDQRTGLAMGDRITSIASPAGLIETPIDREDGNALIEDIGRQVRTMCGGSFSDTDVIIGLPLNMDGTRGPRAKLVLAIAEKIAMTLGCRIGCVDERRSSIAADQKMSQSGLTHKQKKKRRDAIAAANIATSFLTDPEMLIEWIEPGADE